jgi:hypothetical protein
MAAPELQANRYELKYLIPERVALQVRDFVSGYLEIDEYGATMPDLSYPVHSLYIDSRGLYTYWATINGDKNRYKLRLRYYTDKPDAPVFFEIKRRTDNVISKQRCGVRRSSVPAILSGQLPYQTDLLSKDPKQYRALQNFLRLMMEIGGQPCSHIFYMREAWISTYDNSVRVTMDRSVQCEPDPTVKMAASMVNPVMPFGNQVILELKFTARFPDWFRTMVETFHLPQCGAAKYALGIETYGEHRMMGAFAFDGNGSPAKITSSEQAIPAPTSPKASPIVAAPAANVSDAVTELAGKQ